MAGILGYPSSTSIVPFLPPNPSPRVKSKEVPVTLQPTVTVEKTKAEEAALKIASTLQSIFDIQKDIPLRIRGTSLWDALQLHTQSIYTEARTDFLNEIEDQGIETNTMIYHMLSHIEAFMQDVFKITPTVSIASELADRNCFKLKYVKRGHSRTKNPGYTNYLSIYQQLYRENNGIEVKAREKPPGRPKNKKMEAALEA